MARRLGTRRVPLRLVTLATVLAIASLWYLITAFRVVSPLFLPSPAAVVTAFWEMIANGYAGRSLAEHVATSLIRIFLGFGSGIAVGTVLGLAMSYSRFLDRMLNPFVEFFRPLPQLSYLVLLIVFFGLTDFAQVVLLFLAALPISIVATREGVRRTDVQQLRVAQSLGATRLQLFVRIVMPSALPELFTGGRIAIGVVYVTVVSAEMIAGTSGIGWVVMDASRELAMPYVFAGVFVLGIVGLGLDLAIQKWEVSVIHWAGRS